RKRKTGMLRFSRRYGWLAKEGTTEAGCPYKTNLLCRRGGCLFAINVFEASSFATQSAQVVELCAANFRAAHDLDFVHDPRALGEDALDALSKADLANGEAGLRAASARQHHAFER